MGAEPLALATANFRTFRSSLGHAVSIARFPPRWETGYALLPIRELAPSWKEWQLRGDGPAYFAAYRARMDALGPERVMSLIRAVVPSGTAVLLCHCSLRGVLVEEWPTTCHRRALARFLELETGQLVPELG